MRKAQDKMKRKQMMAMVKIFQPWVFARNVANYRIVRLQAIKINFTLYARYKRSFFYGPAYNETKSKYARSDNNLA